jgi:hypothetical protein
MNVMWRLMTLTHDEPRYLRATAGQGGSYRRPRWLPLRRAPLHTANIRAGSNQPGRLRGAPGRGAARLNVGRARLSPGERGSRNGAGTLRAPSTNLPESRQSSGLCVVIHSRAPLRRTATGIAGHEPPSNSVRGADDNAFHNDWCCSVDSRLDASATASRITQLTAFIGGARHMM